MSQEALGNQPPPEGQKYTPAMIEEAHGDVLLLERLAGLQRARAFLENNPDSPTFQELCSSMEEIVAQRKRELGLLPPEEPARDEPEKGRWHHV